MDKKFSLSEVDDFIAKFKKKAKKNAGIAQKKEELKQSPFILIEKNTTIPQSENPPTLNNKNLFDDSQKDNDDNNLDNIFQVSPNNNKETEVNIIGNPNSNAITNANTNTNANKYKTDTFENIKPISQEPKDLDPFKDENVINNPLITQPIQSNQTKSFNLFGTENDDNVDDLFGSTVKTQETNQPNIFDEKPTSSQPIVKHSLRKVNPPPILKQKKGGIVKEQQKEKVKVKEKEKEDTIIKTQKEEKEINSLNIIKTQQFPLNNDNKIEEPKSEIHQPLNDNISIKNIYNNFSTELNAKSNVFQSDYIANEIEKLDDDDNFSPEDPVIDSTQHQNISSFYPQSSINNEPPAHSSFDGIKQNSINNEYSSNSEANYLRTFTSNGKIISQSESGNIILQSQNALLKPYEKILYKDYFPSSYSEGIHFENSIHLLTTMQDYYDKNQKDLKHNFLNSYIVIFFELMLLKNNMQLERSNIFSKDNISNKFTLISAIKAKIASREENIITFKLNIQNKEDTSNGISYDMTNSSLRDLSTQCWNAKSFDSFLLFSLYNSQSEINNYINSLFTDGYLNKESYFYILFLFKSNKINNISLDDYDIIFNNFHIFTLLLLENYNDKSFKEANVIIDKLIKSESKKKKWFHYVILKFLKGDFAIEDEKSYGDLFASYLNLPMIGKIVIADIFNFTLFKLNTSNQGLIGRSSMLIKFKYVLLKQYENDERVNELGGKINENIAQFGEIGKNLHFQNYLNYYYPINTQLQPQVQSNQITQSGVKQSEKSSVGNQKSKGILSYFSTALGISEPASNEGGSENKIKNLTEEEKKKLTPEELWELEHPGEPEMFYDKKLKRYVIRGKIYDDQEEVIQKKNMAKPLVPPPKMKKSVQKQILSEIKKEDSNIGNGLFDNNDVSNPFRSGNSTSVRNNPFAERNAPKVNLNKNIQLRNLANRYAVGYQN